MTGKNKHLWFKKCSNLTKAHRMGKKTLHEMSHHINNLLDIDGKH